MLRIRLSRHGRKKRPFYRIVLTEHLKQVKSGYKDVLGWFDPLAHTMQVDVESVKEWISKGAKPSERVAKLLYKETKDKMFTKYYEERERKRAVKNPKEEDEKPAPAPVEEAPAAPAAEEAPAEEAAAE